MRRQRNCSVCGIGSSHRMLHFRLVVSRKKADGRPTSRGAGTINLCEDCWRYVAARSREHAARFGRA